MTPRFQSDAPGPAPRQGGSSAGADRAAEKEKEKRYRLVLRKQEKLLYVCFHVLLNLAEEPAIEKKMAKRGNRRRFQIALHPA